MNFTNFTTDYQGFHQHRPLCQILTYSDYFLRSLSLTIHIGYFVLVLLVKDLRKKSLVFIHQVNFFGLLFSFHYCLYFGKLIPDFPNESLNNALCTASELFWAFLKYTRSNSIFILALFRLVAVRKFDWFRKWISSSSKISITIVLNLIVSIIFVLVLRFSLSTSFGKMFCFDGYSNDLNNSIIYFVLNTLIAIVIPNFLVILIYVYIIRYVKFNETQKVEQLKMSKSNVRNAKNSITSRIMSKTASAENQKTRSSIHADQRVFNYKLNFIRFLERGQPLRTIFG